MVNSDAFEENTGLPADPLKPGSQKPGSSPASQDQPKRGRSGGGLAFLAVLLATLALALAGWIWWQGNQSQQQQLASWQAEQQQYLQELKRLESAMAAMQSSGSLQAGEADSAALALQQRLEMLEARQNAGEDFRTETSAWSRAAQAALEDSQSRLAAVDERVRNLSARTAESSGELELDEIDYLLRMAQERLELFGDTRTADRALQLADHQVQAFDNPLFIGLRREIAAARQSLAAADLPDLVELGVELDAVQDNIDRLPFRTAGEEQATALTFDPTPAADQPWWDRLKNALAGLVTVRRLDDAELAMPALADQQALRQRAWLEVEQARLAALRREQAIYQASLAQAEATITRWFEPADAAVRSSLLALQALQQRHVDPEMPDISGPWTSLRSIRDAGLSPAVIEAGPPAAEAATPAPSSESIEGFGEDSVEESGEGSGDESGIVEANTFPSDRDATSSQAAADESEVTAEDGTEEEASAASADSSDVDQ